MKEKSIKIIEWVVTIALILLATAWFYGIKVEVDDEGVTTCYNIFNKEVKCR